MESPVLSNSTLKSLLSGGPACNMFLELGPHSALAGPVRQIMKSNVRVNDHYQHTLTKGKGARETILRTVGGACLHSIPVDLESVVSDAHALSDLPLFQWSHESAPRFCSRVD
ncbi:hypothetical protein BJ878DRAFT_514520 [Calycina marina]|uniref:Malonyl-CoA:ACP transacylase (MAT) domain-containing protein n=1 Tax=Calycina marina TaxID=1763456 RepID=A0A9P8CDD8_9HELO|nr:hypothetical protein BJ878DRAFT_514520 [Calycina marina]